MFKEDFIKRQQNIKDDGPKQDFGFTDKNYFPLKINYEENFY